MDGQIADLRAFDDQLKILQAVIDQVEVDIHLRGQYLKEWEDRLGTRR